MTDGWLTQLIALTEVGNEYTKNGNHKEEQEGQEGKTTGTERSDHEAPAAMVGKSGLNTKGTKEAKDSPGEGKVRHFRSLGIGLVGPMSNYASPPQLVGGVPYTNMQKMHDFARQWREGHRGQWFTARKLSGFCLLMKCAVYEAVGPDKVSGVVYRFIEGQIRGR